MKSINTFACCMHMMNDMKPSVRRIKPMERSYGSQYDMERHARSVNPIEGKRRLMKIINVFIKYQATRIMVSIHGSHKKFIRIGFQSCTSGFMASVKGEKEYTQSLQEIDEEYCEDFRMEIAAMVIHMSYGHRDCNKQGKPWYKYSQFCKAKNKRYKSKTFMVNGEPHAYPSNKAFCEGVLQVLIGHYFTNSQVHAIVKAWHSNANESLHSMVYTKVDKDKKTNYDDYTSGVKSGASDWNVGHEQSVTDRFDSMGIPMNGVQASGLEKRRLVGQKHKLYQNLDEVKTKRKVKRHKKNNTDNSYSSCNHTV
eukprot:284283_1